MATDYGQFVTLLTETFEVSPDDISDDATLAEMGLDSLAAAELHVRLQDQYQAHAREDKITEKMTLSQVVAVLRTWEHGQDTDLAEAER
ncbi:acyl carrier protein [Streptomyces shenzhenensis]